MTVADSKSYLRNGGFSTLLWGLGLFVLIGLNMYNMMDRRTGEFVTREELRANNLQRDAYRQILCDRLCIIEAQQRQIIGQQAALLAQHGYMPEGMIPKLSIGRNGPSKLPGGDP